MRGKTLSALIAVFLILCVVTTPASARSSAWKKNTWHLTRAGSLHMYFLLPKHNRGGEFFIAINGPTAAGPCKLVLGSRTERPRQIGFNGPVIADVYFNWPKMRTAARATATCKVVSSVSSVTVVLTSRGTIKLRRN